LTVVALYFSSFKVDFNLQQSLITSARMLFDGVTSLKFLKVPQGSFEQLPYKVWNTWQWSRDHGRRKKIFPEGRRQNGEILFCSVETKKTTFFDKNL